jgi:pimeloyl-ACP methyl ester carboxylesterase
MFLGLLVSVAALALPPCTTATPGCTEWVKIEGHKSRVLVYRNFPLETRNENVTRALVFVHGINRDADNHFRTALASAFLAEALDNTLIVAPRFASNSNVANNRPGNCSDTLAADEANWLCDPQQPDTWRSGGTEVDGGDLSSFDFMDEIVRRVARKDLFPNLKTIVVAGHSAGGQFVIPYAMLNQAEDQIRVPVRYVVSNASSYAYLDEMRPTATALPSTMRVNPAGLNMPAVSGTPAFAPYSDAHNCTAYDNWPYGLQGRTGYGSKLSGEQVSKQLAQRTVTYLLGEADVLPLGVFDTSCSAMAQGPNRLARGVNFVKYVNETHGAHHEVVVVPFCSHSARCMFTSDVALPIVFPR